MQVTSLLTRQESAPQGHSHDHGHDHPHDHHHHGPGESCSGCGHDHSHSEVRLTQVVIGLLFVINGFLVEWFFDRGTMAADGSAMIGAIILGWPIVLTAIKDLLEDNDDVQNVTTNFEISDEDMQKLAAAG